MVEELPSRLILKCQAWTVLTDLSGKQLWEYKILLLLLDSSHHWFAYFVANWVLYPKTWGLAKRARSYDQDTETRGPLRQCFAFLEALWRWDTPATAMVHCNTENTWLPGFIFCNISNSLRNLIVIIQKKK